MQFYEKHLRLPAVPLAQRRRQLAHALINEGRLLRKLESRTQIDRVRQGSLGKPLAAVKARPLHGFEFLVEKAVLLRIECDQIPADPLEITVNAFGSDDLFDTVDRGPMTVSSKFGIRDAEQRFEIGKTIIQHGGQMRSGPRRFAGSQSPGIYYADRFARLL